VCLVTKPCYPFQYVPHSYRIRLPAQPFLHNLCPYVVPPLPADLQSIIVPQARMYALTPHPASLLTHPAISLRVMLASRMFVALLGYLVVGRTAQLLAALKTRPGVETTDGHRIHILDQYEWLQFPLSTLAAPASPREVCLEYGTGHSCAHLVL